MQHSNDHDVVCQPVSTRSSLGLTLSKIIPRQRLVQSVHLHCREAVEFIGVANLAGTRRFVACYWIPETDGKENVRAPWVRRVRRGAVDVVVCHQLAERKDSSGNLVLGRCEVIQIVHHLVQDLLDMRAVGIEGE